MTTKELKFKTNINCGGCIAKVKPYLDTKEGIINWNVDITNLDRILTVQTATLDESQIIDLIESINYKAEPLT